MKKSDITWSNCHAGYRRLELVSKKGTRGEFRCLLCNHVLEVLDGSTDVSIRLTVQPELNGGPTRVPHCLGRASSAEEDWMRYAGKRATSAVTPDLDVFNRQLRDYPLTGH